MSSPPVRIMCPKLTCRTILAVPATARGKVVRCKGCGTALRIPKLATEDNAPAEPGTKAG